MHHPLISQTNKQKSRCRHHRNRVTKPIDQVKDYTDDEAITLAHEMNRVTLLRTNEGRIYINSLTRHAEIVFLEDRPNPVDITELWITNSPCSNCARHLTAHFQLYQRKPTIYIGRIYQPDNQENIEGLKRLLQQGFELQVWETLHTTLNGSDSRKTHKYLRDIKQEAQYTCIDRS